MKQEDLPLAIIHSDTSDSVNHSRVQLNCLHTSMARNLIVLAHDMPCIVTVLSSVCVIYRRIQGCNRMLSGGRMLGKHVHNWHAWQGVCGQRNKD